MFSASACCEDAELLFALLDQDGSSTISPEEFMNFGQVLLLEFVRVSEYASWVEVYCPKLYQSEGYQTFCRVVRSTVFDVVIDIILVLNAVVIAIQTYPELSGQQVDLDSKYWGKRAEYLLCTSLILLLTKCAGTKHYIFF